MTETNLKNLIKLINEKSTLTIFVLGFVIVMMIAFNLFLKTLTQQKSSGKISNEAASTQVGFDIFSITDDEAQKLGNINSNFKINNAQEKEVTAYFVQPGDSSWKIAAELFGDGNRYLEIEKLNDFKHGQYLEIGQVVFVIVGQKLEASEDVNVVENAKVLEDESVDADFITYIVKPGDSLWKISLENYSDPLFWLEIYKFNKQAIGNDPNLIFPLTELKLPVIKSRL